MTKLKKIVLVTSASNFERHKNVIKTTHSNLKQIGNCVLYVVTSYGLYRDEDVYESGGRSIYNLLEDGDFDGCILDGNIDNIGLLERMARTCIAKNLPFVTLNIGMKECPFFMMDSYYACYRQRDSYCS